MVTEKQRKQMNDTSIKLYHNIAAFMKQFGYAPTLREINELMGWDSTSKVSGYLRVLESWKWIEVTGGKYRTMRLIRPTEIEVPLNIQKRASDVSDYVGAKDETQ